MVGSELIGKHQSLPNRMTHFVIVALKEICPYILVLELSQKNSHFQLFHIYLISSQNSHTILQIATWIGTGSGSSLETFLYSLEKVKTSRQNYSFTKEYNFQFQTCAGFGVMLHFLPISMGPMSKLYPCPHIATLWLVLVPRGAHAHQGSRYRVWKRWGGKNSGWARPVVPWGG